MTKKKKKKKKIDVNEHSMKIAETLKSLFSEIEKLLHFKINLIVDEEELKDLYIKTNIGNDMTYEIALFNSKTKAIIIKPYDVLDLVSLCKVNMIETAVEMDLKQLYEQSNLRMYDDITHIVLD